MAEAEAPKKKSKLLLIMIIVVLVLLLAAGGVIALLLMKQSQPSNAGQAGAPAAAAPAPAAAPTRSLVFMPLQLFTVNLSDAGRERFAQVGITLELTDAAMEAPLKAADPILRSKILLLLTSKTSAELATVEGKRVLAEEILALAREVTGAPPPAQGVIAVHFSSFVIQ